MCRNTVSFGPQRLVCIAWDRRDRPVIRKAARYAPPRRIDMVRERPKRKRNAPTKWLEESIRAKTPKAKSSPKSSRQGRQRKSTKAGGEVSSPRASPSDTSGPVYVPQMMLDDASWGKQPRDFCGDFVDMLLDIPECVGNFDKPVMDLWPEKDVPGYLEKVRNPMDLGTIKKKLVSANSYTILLENGRVFDEVAVANDIRLVFQNCMKYNGAGSDFYARGEALLKGVDGMLGPRTEAVKRERKLAKDRARRLQKKTEDLAKRERDAERRAAAKKQRLQSVASIAAVPAVDDVVMEGVIDGEPAVVPEAPSAVGQVRVPVHPSGSCDLPVKGGSDKDLDEVEKMVDGNCAVIDTNVVGEVEKVIDGNRAVVDASILGDKNQGNRVINNRRASDQRSAGKVLRVAQRAASGTPTGLKASNKGAKKPSSAKDVSKATTSKEISKLMRKVKDNMEYWLGAAKANKLGDQHEAYASVADQVEGMAKKVRVLRAKCSVMPDVEQKHITFRYVSTKGLVKRKRTMTEFDSFLETQHCEMIKQHNDRVHFKMQLKRESDILLTTDELEKLINDAAKLSFDNMVVVVDILENMGKHIVVDGLVEFDLDDIPNSALREIQMFMANPSMGISDEDSLHEIEKTISFIEMCIIKTRYAPVVDPKRVGTGSAPASQVSDVVVTPPQKKARRHY